MSASSASSPQKSGPPVPTLESWRWEANGALTGRIYGRPSYRDGTVFTTSVVPLTGRFEKYVRTVSGSTYRLGSPTAGVVEPEPLTSAVRTRDYSRMLAQSRQAREEESRCPICWDSPPADLSITPCGHAFCRTCIMAALRHKRECPTCRSAVASHRLLQRGQSPLPSAPSDCTFPTDGSHAGLQRSAASDSIAAVERAPLGGKEDGLGVGAQGPRPPCGTPGCSLAAFHSGPCLPEAVWAPRVRAAPQRPGARHGGSGEAKREHTRGMFGGNQAEGSASRRPSSASSTAASHCHA